MRPFKAGDNFGDHALPMADVMTQLTAALTEFANFKAENPDFATMKSEHQEMKEQLTTIEEAKVLDWDGIKKMGNFMNWSS